MKHEVYCPTGTKILLIRCVNKTQALLTQARLLWLLKLDVVASTSLKEGKNFLGWIGVKHVHFYTKYELVKNPKKKKKLSKVGIWDVMTDSGSNYLMACIRHDYSDVLFGPVPSETEIENDLCSIAE
ncbi:hypothetical protein Fmac_022783 [Flemingia macrophylla]|uniref:Uncharacterized protein n=1 Tax=Flemingia macrophylla TaxID=520843 RepID=A0ABD1M0W3_9FABA